MKKSRSGGSRSHFTLHPSLFSFLSVPRLHRQRLYRRFLCIVLDRSGLVVGQRNDERRQRDFCGRLNRRHDQFAGLRYRPVDVQLRVGVCRGVVIDRGDADDLPERKPFDVRVFRRDDDRRGRRCRCGARRWRGTCRRRRRRPWSSICRWSSSRVCVSGDCRK